MGEDMSGAETRYQISSLVHSNNASTFCRIKRRSAIEIFLDEGPILSDSENEMENDILTFAISPRPVNCTTGILPSGNMLSDNKGHNQLKDQLLMLVCHKCVCCKKIQEFVEHSSTADVSDAPSSSSSNCTIGASSFYNYNGKTEKVNDQSVPAEETKIFSCQTITPLKNSIKEDDLDKRFDDLIRSGAATSTGKDEENATLVPEKKPRGLPKKVMTNMLMDSSQDEEKAILPSEKKPRGRPKKSMTNTSMDSSQDKENAAIPPKNKQRGRPKNSIINVGMDSSEAYGKSLFSSEDDDIPPQKHDPLKRSLKAKDPKRYYYGETNPYHLKREIRSRNISLNKHLFNTTVATRPIAPGSFSKAVVRRLARTGGISLDLTSDYLRKTQCQKRKSRTLYDLDVWLNSNAFLEMNEDK